MNLTKKIKTAGYILLALFCVIGFIYIYTYPYPEQNSYRWPILITLTLVFCISFLKIEINTKQLKALGYFLSVLLCIGLALYLFYSGIIDWNKANHIPSLTIVCGVVLILLAIYPFKKLMVMSIFLIILIPLSINAQDSHREQKNFNDDITKHDTIVHQKSVFKQEKGGQACVNGVEKLEAAGATDLSFLFATQIHFYAPSILEGRIFGEVEEEKKDGLPNFFFNGTFGLTVREFPLHLSGNIKFDQLHKEVSYGPGFDMYWSDISRFKILNQQINIPKTFHILRTSVTRLSVVKSIPTKHDFGDSSSIKKLLEYSLFFQMQPLHLTHDLSIFSEGSFRFNEEDDFMEVEVGLRHEKIFDNLIGLGVRTAWEDSKFHSVAGVVRFNISNPNPKHLKK